MDGGAWWEADVPRKPKVLREDDGQWSILWRCCWLTEAWSRHRTSAGAGPAGWNRALRWAIGHACKDHPVKTEVV